MRKFALLGIAVAILSLTACGSKAEHAVSNELQHENPSVKPPVKSRQEETEKEDIAVESEFLVPDDETLVTVIDYIPSILVASKGMRKSGCSQDYPVVDAPETTNVPPLLLPSKWAWMPTMHRCFRRIRHAL